MVKPAFSKLIFEALALPREAKEKRKVSFRVYLDPQSMWSNSLSVIFQAGVRGR